MMKPPLVIATALVFLAGNPCWSGPGRAPGGEDAKPVKKVDLLVLDPGGQAGPTGAPPIRMGLLIELEPGWHLYWLNPGDAGLAPQVRWKLPPGFEASPLLHPLPQKSVTEGIVAYEHTSPVLLVCDIRPPLDPLPDAPWEVAAVLEWMACRESCVTGEARVRAVYPPGAAALEKGRALLATFSPRFPRPLSAAGLSAGTAQAVREGGEWRVEFLISGPRAAEVNDFFPYPLENFVIAHSRIACRGGRVVLPLAPSRGPGAPPPQIVRGLALLDGAGYECSVLVLARPSRTPTGTPSIFSGR